MTNNFPSIQVACVRLAPSLVRYRIRAPGVHNMLRARVCAAHMGGFLGPNSLNKGPFFGRFSINKGGLFRTWRKIAKNGWFSAKIHHKSGSDRKFR